MARLSSKALLREHSALAVYVSAYTDREGKLYMFPSAFPVVLFDDHGYVIFGAEPSLRRDPHVRTFIADIDGKERFHVTPCLDCIQGYVSCGHEHS